MAALQAQLAQSTSSSSSSSSSSSPVLAASAASSLPAAAASPLLLTPASHPQATFQATTTGALSDVFTRYVALHNAVTRDGKAGKFVVVDASGQMNNRIRALVSALVLGLLTDRVVLINFKQGICQTYTPHKPKPSWPSSRTPILVC